MGIDFNIAGFEQLDQNHTSTYKLNNAILYHDNNIYVRKLLHIVCRYLV